jgi:hypothetical protein
MTKIKLYHYSNRDFEGYIDPAFFGYNSYSGNSKRLSEVKRSYFYLEPSQREYYLRGAKFLYITEISQRQLYNLNKDKLSIGNKSSQYIYRNIKRRGYRGLIGNNGYKCGVLFYRIKIKTKKTLTRANLYDIL